MLRYLFAVAAMILVLGRRQARCVTLCCPNRQFQEDLWQTRKRHVRTQFVAARRNRAENIAAPPARGRARQLNLIATVVTRSVREISNR